MNNNNNNNIYHGRRRCETINHNPHTVVEVLRHIFHGTKNYNLESDTDKQRQIYNSMFYVLCSMFYLSNWSDK